MIARDFAEEAVRQNHELWSLSTTTRENTDEGIADDVVGGVKIRRYAPKLPYYILEDAEQSLGSRLMWHAKDLVGSRATSDLVTETIKESSPDVIVTFNLRGMEIGSVVRAIRRSRINWIHELHDVQLLVPSGLEWFGPQKRVGLRWLWQSRIVKMFYGWLTGYIMGSPGLVVSPSVYMIDAHKKMGLFVKSESHVLINPVDLDVDRARFTPNMDGRAKVDKTQDHDKVTKLLYVGQLELHKGVHDVLEALKHVSEHKVELDIVGAGSQQDELMNQVLEHPDSVVVRFHGRVSHERVFEFMASASALVLPSVVVENCPGVILEARSVGLPVIASNVGGIPELIAPEGLFEPADPRGIAEKIHLLAEGKVSASSKDDLISVSIYVDNLLKQQK